ncbi:MAG TPA: IS30 family transposase [Candidatus Corynebacterium gallistercoris]|uniref:IS30 family transposase n=1 Tax=Candidatus Corynebacterium gallistercoris TaxID=2838530 RepID=A0A9D1RWB5_9CORY|nr:IS30 family transposase [Candidatus Corynebacterium gallistercoris]
MTTKPRPLRRGRTGGHATESTPLAVVGVKPPGSDSRPGSAAVWIAPGVVEGLIQPLAGSTLTKQRRNWVQDAHISLRPPEVDDRAVWGRWEGDLVIGGDGKTALITLVERTTRFVLIRRLPVEHDSKTVTTELADMVTELNKPGMWKSITWDQGVEMAKYKQSFKVDPDVRVFFADPHSPWQRGTDENTNRNIREFFPKGTDFSQVSDKEVEICQESLNTRARVVLGGLKCPGFCS